MNEHDVRNALKRLRVKPLHSEGGWVMAHCPFATWRHGKGTDSTPSFGVSFSDDDASYYHCFTCKSKGPLPGLAFTLAKLRPDERLMEFGRKLERDEILGSSIDFGDWHEKYHVDSAGNPETAYRPRNFPPRDEFLRYPSAAAEPDSLRYLASRRIPFDTVIQAGLRFDARKDRILFPVLDYWTGRYVGCTGRVTWSERRRKRVNEELEAAGLKRRVPKVRDYSGLEKRKVFLGTYGRSDRLHDKRQRNRNPHIWIICEGLFAYLRFVALGFGNVTLAILGSELTEEKAFILKHSKRPIYWFTDPDQGGWQCLFGSWDAEGERFKGGGALDLMYGECMQYIPQWGDVTDPDDLESRDQVLDMLHGADFVSKKSLTQLQSRYSL